MKQELVEKVAERLARAHFGVTGEWAEAQRLSVAFIEAARYAIALAERAARAGIAATRLCHESLAMAQTKVGEDAFAEEAVERAVEGA